MIPIEKFIQDWTDGQVRKFRAEIEEWEVAESINIYDCDLCGLELDECDCGGLE